MSSKDQDSIDTTTAVEQIPCIEAETIDSTGPSTCSANSSAKEHEGVVEETGSITTEEVENNVENGDAMVALLSVPPEFQATLRIALAALKYGAVSYKLEKFVVRLLKRFGYSCSFWVINKYMHLSIYHYAEPRQGNLSTRFSNLPDTEEGRERNATVNPSSLVLPYTVTVPVVEGADLQKLEDLSSICADLLHHVIDLQEADSLLKDLEESGNHWDIYSRTIAYTVTSAGFALLLRGSWTDSWLSLFGGFFALLATTAFSRFWPDKRNAFGLFAAAFLPGVLATSVALKDSFRVDSNIVVMSSLISEVPGFGITRGMSELGKNRILVGLGHWIGSFLTCVWLAFGATTGAYFALFMAETSSENADATTSTTIDGLWYLVVAPVSGLCFSIYFSVGRPQLFMSVAICSVACGMSLTIPRFTDPNLGNVVAAFVTTLSAQIWSRSWHHKLLYGMGHMVVPSPSTIVMLPAFFVLVGGSIGVRAFSFIVVGDMDDGGNTLLQFLLVPATLVLGMYLAQSILPSTSVL